MSAKSLMTFVFLCGLASGQQPPGGSTGVAEEAARPFSRVQIDGQVAKPVPTTPIKAAVAVPGATVVDSSVHIWIQGDYAATMRGYDQQRQAAAQRGDKHAEAAALIGKAKVIETSSLTGKDQQNRYVQAIDVLDEASKVGDPTQRALAQNNRAALLMRIGKQSDALAIYRNIDWSGLDPSQQSICRYNFGRALEEQGDLASAYMQYSAALELNPEFGRAVDAAFRSLRASKSPEIDATVSLADRLVAGKHTEELANNLYQAIQAWAQIPSSTNLLAPLLRYYVAATVDQSAFQKSGTPVLEQASNVNPSWKSATEDLNTAYLATLKLPAEAYQANARFPFFSATKERSVASSALLKMIGDLRARAGDNAQALSRYFYAWGLNRENTESLVYLTALLREYPDLDPRHAFLNRLIENLFSMKGEAYRSSDYLNVLRLHTLLGTVYEDLGKWGPESCAGDNGPWDRAHCPRNALFQWEHALAAAEQVRKQNPNFPPSPALYFHLGQTYSHVGRQEDAATNFLTSAEGYLQLGEAGQAASAMKQFDLLPSSLKSSPRADSVRRALIGKAPG